MKRSSLNHNERYMLKGSLKKNGFDHWRIVTNGKNSSTGEERTFFIEFYVVNPALSPKECVLGFKNRFNASETDLHNALAGTESAHKIKTENYVKPCFAMVKAGVYGEGGKQINNYFPTESIKYDRLSLILQVENSTNSCFLSSEETAGTVSVKAEDLENSPELLSQTGKMSWQLSYKKQYPFLQKYKSKTMHWYPFGMKTLFSGTITFDGEEYIVEPEDSCGFIDKNWGKEFPTPFFHLNASNCTNIINGKTLTDSCLVVQGVYNDRICVFSQIQGKNFNFHAKSWKKNFIEFKCNEVPSEDDETSKLHWSVSINSKRYVVDIDVFCSSSLMFLRDYELPTGDRKLMRILGGGSGTGELKIFKQIKKNLELIENIRMDNIICEYGNVESPAI